MTLEALLSIQTLLIHDEKVCLRTRSWVYCSFFGSAYLMQVELSQYDYYDVLTTLLWFYVFLTVTYMLCLFYVSIILPLNFNCYITVMIIFFSCLTPMIILIYSCNFYSGFFLYLQLLGVIKTFQIQVKC